jgi:hypothetical protein
MLTLRSPGIPTIKEEMRVRAVIRAYPPIHNGAGKSQLIDFFHWFQVSGNSIQNMYNYIVVGKVHFPFNVWVSITRIPHNIAGIILKIRDTGGYGSYLPLLTIFISHGTPFTRHQSLQIFWLPAGYSASEL